MARRCCATCRWWRCARGPTNRPRPSEKGECTWAEFDWPAAWPASYRVWNLMYKPQPVRMHGSAWYDCPTWVERAQKPAKPALLALTDEE